MPSTQLLQNPALVACLAITSCHRPTEPRDPAEHGEVRAAETPVEDVVPMETTPLAELSTETLEHTELLRLGRDFGKQDFEIALDAWVDRRRPRELALVRLWWARIDRDLERSPFGSKTRRHFDIADERLAPDHWRIDLVSDRKVFSFDIEIDPEGKPAAHASVRAEDGQHVEHCRVDRGELLARRVLRVPAGIEALAVVCKDAEGTLVRGTVIWTPESK
jgi:hypothetical protein